MRRMRARTLTLAAALSVFVSGCELNIFGIGADEYEGFVSLAFEANEFLPCGATNPWWLAGGDDLQTLVAGYEAAKVAGAEQVFARVRGDRSGRGSYGHLGAYERELRVGLVLEVRAARQTDCR